MSDIVVSLCRAGAVVADSGNALRIHFVTVCSAIVSVSHEAGGGVIMWFSNDFLPNLGSKDEINDNFYL